MNDLPPINSVIINDDTKDPDNRVLREGYLRRIKAEGTASFGTPPNIRLGVHGALHV